MANYPLPMEALENAIGDHYQNRELLERALPYLEYKSFLIDRENGLFGFAYHEYGHSNQQFYVLP